MAVINKLWLFTALGVVMLSNIPIAMSAPQDLSGTYRCTGDDPYTKSFTENIILKKDGDIYKVELMGVNSALPSHTGIGIVNKDIDNAFGFVYWKIAKPDVKGTQIVHVKPDGSLSGIYSNYNEKVIGTENCKKITTH